MASFLRLTLEVLLQKEFLMILRRYWFTFLTVSALAAAPLSLVAAADPMPRSPEAVEAERDYTPTPMDETQSPHASQPSASVLQRQKDDSFVTRNPEADRKDMEKRYPTTTDPMEKPSDKSKQVGS
jgi:hypothetical protein